MSCDCWPTMPPFRRRLSWICGHGNRWAVQAANDAFTDGAILVWARRGGYGFPAPR